MKYTTEITIGLPRSTVVKLFDSTENLYKWQEGLKSFKTISGEPGQAGARSEMIYESRRGDLIMTETITRRNFPEEFHGTYEAKGVYNEVYNYFTEQEPGSTLWRQVSVFRFRGLMAFMAPFMKSAFTKNTLLNMERFKAFAENQVEP
jgi:hypothetical protein